MQQETKKKKKRLNASYLRRQERRFMKRLNQFGPSAHIQMNNWNYNSYNYVPSTSFSNFSTNTSDRFSAPNEIELEQPDIYAHIKHPLTPNDPRVCFSKRPSRTIDPIPDPTYQTKLIPLEPISQIRPLMELNIKIEPNNDIILLSDYDKREAQLKKLNELNLLEEQIKQSLNYVQKLKEDLIRQMLI